MPELPASIRNFFAAAGWLPGRRVEISASIPADHPAATILAEFGGLTVARFDEDARGEECAVGHLGFRELFPDNLINLRWRRFWKNTHLIGIADIHHSHAEWYIDTRGRIIGTSCQHDAFWLAGEMFCEAVERSLYGRRNRPILLPDQSSVTLYGDEFTSESPELYRYE
jgi:hypothetical protein